MSVLISKEVLISSDFSPLDKEAPSIRCPSNIVQATDSLSYSAKVSWPLPTTSDNSGGSLRTQATDEPGLIVPFSVEKESGIDLHVFTCGVSWPSGLAYRTQVLVLATECGFESQP